VSELFGDEHLCVEGKSNCLNKEKRGRRVDEVRKQVRIV
jgi:hypothetical protein